MKDRTTQDLFAERLYNVREMRASRDPIARENLASRIAMLDVEQRRRLETNSSNRRRRRRRTILKFRDLEDGAIFCREGTESVFMKLWSPVQVIQDGEYNTVEWLTGELFDVEDDELIALCKAELLVEKTS